MCGVSSRRFTQVDYSGAMDEGGVVRMEDGLNKGFEDD